MTDYPSTHWGEAPCASNSDFPNCETKPVRTFSTSAHYTIPPTGCPQKNPSMENSKSRWKDRQA